MTTERRIGIIISADASDAKKGTDAAEKGLRGLWKSIRDAGKAARDSQPSIGGMFKVFGVGLMALEAGVSLFKRLGGAVADSFGRMISASLAYRGENDALTQSLNKTKDTMGRTAARVFDPFARAVGAIGEAIRPLLGQIEQWAVANQQVIMTGILEWVFKIVEAVGVGGVQAFGFFERVVIGVQGALLSAKWAGEKFFQSITWGDLSEEFKRSADESADGIAQLAVELTDGEERTTRMSKAVTDLTSKLEGAALAASGKTGTGGLFSAENMKEIEDEANSLFESMLSGQEAGRKSMQRWNDVAQDLREQYKQDRLAYEIELDKRKQKDEEYVRNLETEWNDFMVGTLEQVGSGFAQFFGDIITGAKTAEQALASLGLSLLRLGVSLALQTIVTAATGGNVVAGAAAGNIGGQFIGAFGSTQAQAPAQISGPPSGIQGAFTGASGAVVINYHAGAMPETRAEFEQRVDQALSMPLSRAMALGRLGG